MRTEVRTSGFLQRRAAAALPPGTLDESFVAGIKEHGPPSVPFAAVAGSGPLVRPCSVPSGMWSRRLSNCYLV
jgi:hypothetical protein